MTAMTTATAAAAGNPGTTETVQTAPPLESPPGRRRGPTPIPVRIKIAATIALVTAAAMAAAGLLVYVLESAQIDNDLHQQIDQEIAELRRLQGGNDPQTTEPFDSVERLLKLYRQRNVTDDDEMLVTYVDGEVRGSTPNQFGKAILSPSRLPARPSAELADSRRHRGDRQPRVPRGVGHGGAGRE